MAHTNLEIYKMLIGFSKKAESEGNLTHASSCISKAILTALKQATQSIDSVGAGTRTLIEFDAGTLLAEYLRLVGEDFEKESPVPKSERAGSCYELTVFVHVCMLLEDQRLARKYIALALMPEVKGATLPFWKRYSECLNDFLNRQSFCLPDVKLKGQQSYIFSYLKLMFALLNGDSVADAVSEVDENFRKRQADRSIKDDNWSIEGSPYSPTVWDYRKDSINQFWNSKVWGTD